MSKNVSEDRTETIQITFTVERDKRLSDYELSVIKVRLREDAPAWYAIAEEEVLARRLCCPT